MDYMSVEKNVGYENEPYEMETDAQASDHHIAEALQPTSLAYQPPKQSTVDCEAELELLRRFLEKAYISQSIVRGDRQQKLKLLRNNLRQNSQDPSA